MKRILLTFIIALFATTFMFGQDIYLTWGGKKLADTVYVWGEPDASLIVFNAIFHNDSDNGMNVLVVRKEMSMLDNTISAFCWGACYSPTVDTSLKHQFIPAGGQSDSTQFTGDYTPNGVIGTSIIKYTFYNMDNPDQRLEVVAKFWASPEGIA
ncbi:MAG TPA: hypothetical protein ENH02_00875, partial [Bacteroidetes bacterium]|nr:hypothetical protein [Bacteroidota bacterium]